MKPQDRSSNFLADQESGALFAPLARMAIAAMFLSIMISAARVSDVGESDEGACEDLTCPTGFTAVPERCVCTWTDQRETYADRGVNIDFIHRELSAFAFLMGLSVLCVMCPPLGLAIFINRPTC